MIQRLQKIIAASGLMARRKAEEAISAGRVTVNGRPAGLGDSADPSADRILVDGKELPTREKMVYIILNKPRGLVCSLHDEKGRRDLSDLFRDRPERLFPVGRLDMDSEGLLLLTNDGAIANAMMHPSREMEKCYHTWVKGKELAAALELLRSPLVIDGYAIRPARVELLERLPEGAVLSITIHEGRNRQIRKMCEQAGLTVTRLCRVREGSLLLGALRPGQWRELSDRELALLRKEASL